MISAESHVYYAAFCVACAVLGAAYLRLQATQRVTMTTKEFKGFQNNFLVGYVPLMLVELLYLAFFFYVMMYHGLSLEATGKLFIGNHKACEDSLAHFGCGVERWRTVHNVCMEVLSAGVGCLVRQCPRCRQRRRHF